MKKRLMILFAAGIFAFSMPVYADPQSQDPAIQTNEMVSASSDASSTDLSTDEQTNEMVSASSDASSTGLSTDDNTENGTVMVTEEADDPVSHVMSMIGALPAYDKLTMNDQQVVDEVQTAYDDLSDVQKELVLNRETLKRAQQKLQEISDQSLYTYSFTLTDKYPVARMTLSYAPPSDDSLDTQVKLGSKTGDAAFEIVTPDHESFILTPDTKSYDTKTVHFTVTWSNTSAEIKAENCELGTWFMKSSYPVSFAVQKYESTDEMDEEAMKDTDLQDVSSSSVSALSETQQTANTNTSANANAGSGSAANPFAGVIGMLAAVVAIGVGAVILVKFLSKKKFTQPEENEDEPTSTSVNHENPASSQIQNAESMDDLNAIMNSKWMNDMDSVSDAPEQGNQDTQWHNQPSDDWKSDEMKSQKPQQSWQPQTSQDAEHDDDDYGFSDPEPDYGGNNRNISSDSMHDSDFMDDDDDDSDTSRDTTYLSYEENIDEETGILNDGSTKIQHKQPFYPKNSYDPDSGK